jgi:hypothetical protein
MPQMQPAARYRSQGNVSFLLPVPKGAGDTKPVEESVSAPAQAGRMTFHHDYSRVRRYFPSKWKCRRCGKLYRIRTSAPCAWEQLRLPLF